MFGKNDTIDKRLNFLFIELQDEEKIIDKNIKLTIDTKTSNFQGLNIFSIKRIRYNPIFFQESLANYDDNIIRFVLLHEVGHISTGSWLRIENIVVTIAAFTLLSIGMVDFFIQDFLMRLLLWVLIFGLLMLILRFLIQFMFKSMKNLEYRADEFAFQKMREHYEISNPCSFIDDCFNAMTAIQQDEKLREKLKPTFFQKIIAKSCGLEEDYHPTNEERVNKLKKISKCE